jgi:hypothetical protein
VKKNFGAAMLDFAYVLLALLVTMLIGELAIDFFDYLDARGSRVSAIITRWRHRHRAHRGSEFGGLKVPHTKTTTRNPLVRNPRRRKPAFHRHQNSEF